jgi:hypothetical protein
MTQGSLEDNIEASGLHATSQRHTRTSKCPPEPYTISEREAVREGERVKESFGWVNPLRCGSSSASSHKQQFLSLSLSSPLTPTHKNKAHASGGRAQLEVLELGDKDSTWTGVRACTARPARTQRHHMSRMERTQRASLVRQQCHAVASRWRSCSCALDARSSPSVSRNARKADIPHIDTRGSRGRRSASADRGRSQAF